MDPESNVHSHSRCLVHVHSRVPVHWSLEKADYYTSAAAAVIEAKANASEVEIASGDTPPEVEVGVIERVEKGNAADCDTPVGVVAVVALPDLRDWDFDSDSDSGKVGCVGRMTDGGDCWEGEVVVVVDVDVD